MTLIKGLLAGFMALAAMPVGPARAAGPDRPVTSVYSDLQGSSCRSVSRLREGDETVRRCRGIAGYSLLVIDSDSRMSITVVAPGGREAPLEFWSVVTRSFTELVSKAEWRVRRAGGRLVPEALIVTVRLADGDSPHRPHSTLFVVIKVTPSMSCVIARLEPGLGMTEARRVADAAATAPCLAPLR